jgi:hypothetical protein
MTLGTGQAWLLYREHGCFGRMQRWYWASKWENHRMKWGIFQPVIPEGRGIMAIDTRVTRVPNLFLRIQLMQPFQPVPFGYGSFSLTIKLDSILMSEYDQMMPTK